jgi:hypothetical protein
MAHSQMKDRRNSATDWPRIRRVRMGKSITRRGLAAAEQFAGLRGELGLDGAFDDRDDADQDGDEEEILRHVLPGSFLGSKNTAGEKEGYLLHAASKVVGRDFTMIYSEPWQRGIESMAKFFRLEAGERMRIVGGIPVLYNPADIPVFPFPHGVYFCDASGE